MSKSEEESNFWTRENEDIGIVENAFAFPIREWLEDKNGDEKNVTVLEWGCGPGTTLRQVADTPGLGDVDCFGYSLQKYTQFKKKHPRIEFLSGISTDEVGKKFENNSLDLIYGFSSLFHLKSKELKSAVEVLLPKLKVGGVFLFQAEDKNCDGLRKLVEKQGSWRKVEEKGRSEEKKMVCYYDANFEVSVDSLPAVTVNLRLLYHKLGKDHASPLKFPIVRIERIA